MKKSLMFEFVWGKYNMSRWQKRTLEEKKLILEEQEETKKRKEHPEKYGNRSSDRALEIYHQACIPIMCPKDGWVGSLDYEIILDNHPLNPSQKVEILVGNCLICNKKIRRAFPPIISIEMIMFMAAVSSLKIDGRLIDSRKNKWQKTK